METIRFTRSNDFYSAGLATLRTTLVMAALAVFWIASAWPLGSFAMILATVFAGLFASAPNPARSVYTTFAGFFLGAVASFICEFFVLSRMDGYGLFVASSAPFLMVGLLMVTRPKLVNAGVGYTIGFTLTLAVKNQTVFDVVHFLNEMVADLVGLGAAAISFVFVLPTFGSPWFRHRQFELLRRQVSVAAQAPMPGLRHRFESLNHDLFVQIAAQTERGSKDSRALFAWALAVNETGRALIQLRSDMSEGEWPKGITLAITRAIDALARLYERPSAEAYQHAIETLKAAIGQVEQHDIAHPLLAHLHLLRMMLLDEESVLAQYMPPKTTAAGADHAT